MFTAWKKLSRNQRQSWQLVAGVITLGTLVKVAYFKFSRGRLVSDSNRQQEEAIKHLQEARNFAEWSKKDREARLPKLTEEQRQQLKEYLELIEQHSIRKTTNDMLTNYENVKMRGHPSTDDNVECVGCPVIGSFQRAVKSSDLNRDA